MNDVIGGIMKKQIILLLFTLMFILLLNENGSAQRFSLNTSTGLSNVVILDSEDWNTGILASFSGYFRFNSKINAGVSFLYNRMPKNIENKLNYEPWLEFGFNTRINNGSLSVIEIIPMIRINLTDYKSFDSGFIFQTGIGWIMTQETKNIESQYVRSSIITKEYCSGFNLGLGYILYKNSRLSYEYLFQFKTVFTERNFTQIVSLGIGITFNK
jgi:hypothetical protein